MSAVARRNFYRLAPAGLIELRGWLETLWDDALASFAIAAEMGEPTAAAERAEIDVDD